ncbi:AAA domain-containing protein [Actinomyces sp.]|uniref:AAA domain-containing protein n=1 Tax=Actinomyces sp. TaxID=29317 RepID=UPI0026DD3719|nr:AAA domain-containing protein [Actinomyces sp.]MDO4900555.1 AAA domain-containing protein [Actinomyces sp.]
MQVDEHGRLVQGSAVLSSALWAVARISGTGAAPSVQWADSFASANKAFGEQVDVAEGLRRDKIGADTPLPQDAESLQRLLGIAYGAAEISGDNPLSSNRIMISSTLAPEGREDAAADTDFLNSFFLTELATVQREVDEDYCPLTLAVYLKSDKSLPIAERIDVMQQDRVVDAAVGINRLLPGRWPSEPAHPLSLRQQFAVNRALNDLAANDGVMGFNGPPGTGKTTMLRDILAGNVVERARRLASLERPKQAFTDIVHRWNSSDGYPRRVRQLRSELTGFEMIVVSANNAAVENISVEIPAREAIAPRWREEADYFADIATAVMADGGEVDAQRQEAWGLVAARLGNKRNRAAFRSAFWFEQQAWIPPETSVQTLVDRAAWYGTMVGRDEGRVWVSAPLTVHRRCDDPMFSLCNRIAYDGIMISGVQRRLDDPEHQDLFDVPEGPRIASSRWFDVPATQRGTHLQEQQIDCLDEQLDALIGRGVDPAQIIALSPFREVADRLSELAVRRGLMSGGTIHTAQGREADVVFLVLGGDPGSPGAKAWAASSVNLVNVATSRAKRRLYVIGDRQAWIRYPYFSDLGAALESQPGAGPNS